MPEHEGNVLIFVSYGFETWQWLRKWSGFTRAINDFAAPVTDEFIQVLRMPRRTCRPLFIASMESWEVLTEKTGHKASNKQNEPKGVIKPESITKWLKLSTTASNSGMESLPHG